MKSLVERLQAKIQVTDDCWLWTGGMQPDGYGRISVNGRYRVAHRVVYEQLIGPIPEGLELDHLCRVRHCVNPKHLEPVTTRENTARSASKAAFAVRTDHCVNGHPYNEANTYRKPDGCRDCRLCNLRRVREYKARRAASNGGAA